MTRYLDPLRTFLEERYADLPHLWTYSEGNALPADWLVATPEHVWDEPYATWPQAVPIDASLADLSHCDSPGGGGCQTVTAAVTEPGASAPSLRVGHSWRIYEQMYQVMTSGRVLVDFTTLTPPTGRELDAFLNALVYLSHLPEDERPVVRILYSDPWPNVPPLTANAMMSEITRVLDPARRMEVYVTVMSSSFSSWNHAKIVAADGVEVLTGGHNMWGAHYLGVNPVFDVSMRTSGPAARGAHLYAEGLWGWERYRQGHLKEWLKSFVVSMHLAYRFDAASGRCAVSEDVLPDEALWERLSARFPGSATGSVPMLGVGRVGDARVVSPLPTYHNWDQAFVEPSDQAFLQLIDAARTRVRMSLQALSLADGWVAAMNDPLFEAWGRAMRRGVDVELVLSNPKAVAGGLTAASAPYDGERPELINQKMLLVLTERLGVATAAAQQLIRDRFAVGGFRWSQEATYPDGTQIANHAKTFIVDDAVFYIGSQNQYASNLNEYGLLVEDATAAADYVERYWAPLWRVSAPQGTRQFDESLSQVEEMDALAFVLALDEDSRLGAVFAHLRAQHDAASGDPEAAAALAEQMNRVILNAGFATSVERVLALLQRTDPGKDPGVEVTPEAIRFVINLMGSPDLMRALLKVIDEAEGGADGLNAAVQAFLDQHGYRCTALQAREAMVSMRRQVLPYWAGSYEVWLTEDGGDAYRFGTAQGQEGTATRSLSEQDAPSPALAGPLVVRSETEVELDGVALKDFSYDGNVLTWEASAGNTSSGRLTFGQVTRPTLVDSFVGMECFGSVTYPADGTSPRRGTVSLYGRVSGAAPDDHDPPSARWPYTLLYVLGALSLAGMAVLAVRYLRDRAARDAWERRARERRDREEPDYSSSDDELIELSTRNREVEVGVLAREGLRRRAVNQQESVRELAELTSGMTTRQRLRLQETATSLERSVESLRDAAPLDLPAVSKAQAQVMDGIFTDVGSLSHELDSLLSDQARTEIQESQRSSEAIGRDVETWFENEERGEPIENFEE